MPEKWLLETYLPRNSGCRVPHIVHAATPTDARPPRSPSHRRTDRLQTTDHSQRAWALICNGIFVTATVASAINVIAAKLS